MDYTSKHFEIIDLYNLAPDSEFNVETDPIMIDRMFHDGLGRVLAEDQAGEDGKACDKHAKGSSR